jgi:hypothetical protein
MSVLPKPKTLGCCRGRTQHGGKGCRWPGWAQEANLLSKPPKIPASDSVLRKFLRMTLAERIKFVELFAGFGEQDWRKFRRMIRKLSKKGEKS